MIKTQKKEKLKWDNKFKLDNGLDNVIKWYMKYNTEFEKLDTKFIIGKMKKTF